MNTSSRRPRHRHTQRVNHEEGRLWTTVVILKFQKLYLKALARTRISRVPGETLTMNAYLVGYNAALCAGWYVAVAVVHSVFAPSCDRCSAALLTALLTAMWSLASRTVGPTRSSRC